MNDLSLGERIKRLRNEQKLTQKEFAEKIHISGDAVHKWEKNVNIPPIQTIIDICTYFQVPLGTLLPETNKTGGKTMLAQLKKVNVNGAKPVEYYGLAETYAGYIAFRNDYNNNTEKQVYRMKNSENNVDMSWDYENSFLLLMDKDSKEINGIRDFGMYLPRTADFVFRSNYVPFTLRNSMPDSAAELRSEGEGVLKLFNKEIEEAMTEAKCKGKKPLFLFDSLGFSNYGAWSLEENKVVCVYNYKKYRTTFGVSEENCVDQNEITKEHNYTVYIPSIELIERLGLSLEHAEHVWNTKMEWDFWERREPKNADALKELENIDYVRTDEMVSVYNKGIFYINGSRENYLGHDMLFANLEWRVAQFERLVHYNAPAVILEGAAKSIDGTIKELEKNMKRNNNKQ